jgi:hypothetical protein
MTELTKVIRKTFNTKNCIKFHHKSFKRFVYDVKNNSSNFDKEIVEIVNDVNKLKVFEEGYYTAIHHVCNNIIDSVDAFDDAASVSDELQSAKNAIDAAQSYLNSTIREMLRYP